MGRKHANELKLTKQKRMRRAYLKPYSAAMIKVPRSINKNTPEIVDGNDYSGMYDYRGRAKGYWESVFDARDFVLSKARLAVFERLATLLNGVAPECNIVVHRGGITKTIIKFFFTPDFRLCYFIKEDHVSRHVYKSLSFHGEGARDRAYFALNNKRIDWVECVPFPNTDVDNSPLTDPEAPSG